MSKNPKEIPIVFMGTSQFASTALGTLLEEKYNIVAVYTQPGKKAGRDQEISKSPVRIMAEEKDIPVFEPEKFEENSLAELSKINPELIIVAAYGKILPKAVLDMPRSGCLNIHGSILPKFRGPSPIQNALLDGETETGVTLILMDEGIDTGNILAQDKLAIGPNETFPELSERLAKISSNLIEETIPRWINQEITLEPQDNSEATLCQLIEREDGRIVWADEANSIYNRYRAFFTWPGIYAFWEKEGKPIRLKLKKIGILRTTPETSRHLGEVFEIGDKIGVMTTSGVITLEEVQMEGKKTVSMREFLNGYPNFLGAILK